MEDVHANVMIDLVKLCRSAIDLAASVSPEEGIDLLAGYFEDARVEDEETRRLLDAWWKLRRADG